MQVFRMGGQGRYLGWADKACIYGGQTRQVFRVGGQGRYLGWMDKAGI